MNRTDAGRRLIDEALAAGFALAGIGPATPSPHADQVRAWLADGCHGEMHYLAEHLDLRLDPGRLVPGARSVLVVADAYRSPAPTAPQARPPRGRIARYAWGNDYHVVMKKRLHALCDAMADRLPGHRFRATVDTAPIMEREHAAAAGLGWIGKHTLLIHPRHGSWFLLGTIVTTIDLPDSGQLGHRGRTVPPADHCGTCTRCIDACPTDAIASAGYRLDATRCISYLTLEHRGPIPIALQGDMDNWIAGCDICQEVCPHNRDRAGEPADDLPIHPGYAPRQTGLNLSAVLDWTTEDRALAFRGSALKRMKLPMVKRNALIAAGNCLAREDQPQLRARISAIARDRAEDDLVRRTAAQVLARLDTPS